MAEHSGKQCPNPLFEQWLSEWISKAESINAIAVKLKYEQALSSLKKYPLLLKTGRECMILEHFDPPMCIKLDRKLVEHNKECPSQDTASNKKLPEYVKSLSNLSEKGRVPSTKEAVPKECMDVKNVVDKVKRYEPRYRSAAFALLLSLLEGGHTSGAQGVSKSDLQKLAQKFCDASFTKPLAGSYYTAWSSMAQLISKSLVTKKGSPPVFYLSDEGKQLAERLQSLYSVQMGKSGESLPVVASVEVTKTTNNILAPSRKSRKKNKNQQESNTDQNEVDMEEDNGPDYFLPNSFDVILLVDTCETIGAAKKSEDETICELTRRDVKFEVRRLKVGDFVWIARHRECGKELVLPYIVERKRLDDLASSIKDGRFAEQKFRLKQCGLKGLIYLVEFMHGKEYHGLPVSSLMQAVTNTQIVDKFSVKLTSTHSESMMYLAFLTKIFTDVFSGKTLFCCAREDLPDEIDLDDFMVSLCSFSNFCHNIGKNRNFNVSDLFLKQLVQLFGLSADKAWSIVEKYPTPKILAEAFTSHGHSILANLTYGHANRKVGFAISKVLCSFYTQLHFTS